MNEKKRGPGGLTQNQCRKIKMAFGPYCHFTGDGKFRDNITINLEPICLGFHLGYDTVSVDSILEIASLAIILVVNKRENEDTSTLLSQFSECLARRPGTVALEPTQEVLDLYKKESHATLARWFIALYHNAGNAYSDKPKLNLDHWHMEFYKHGFDLLGLASSD